MVKTGFILNGREVIDVEIDGINMRDYPDFCDAYFSDAYYKDTNQPLTDDELIELTDNYSDALHEMVYDRIY